MTDPAEPPGFETWLKSVTFNPEAPADDPGEVSAANRQWLLHFFEAEGAAPADAVANAFMTMRVELTNEAVNAVLDDVHRTTSLRPLVIVDVWCENGIRISVDGGYTAPSVWEIERPAAFAEVADYVQAELSSDLGAWPVCGRHDLGLHAEVHEGVAVWWCRRFQHVLAPVGRLGTRKSRPVRGKPTRR